MQFARVLISSRMLALRQRLLGVDCFRDPQSYFGPGGLEEAEALCAEANRDLVGFVRPPARIGPRGLSRDRGRVRRDGVRIEDWSFDSPLPSGDSDNDRVHYRLFVPPHAERDDDVVLFHHPLYQKRWFWWSWFLADLIRRRSVAIMAAPFHFERAGADRFPGEGTCNPNPARMFEALRQWCWDHQAMVSALAQQSVMRPVAEIGFSLGAFQTLLLASAGRIDVPIVSISSTNRYAWGLTHGVLGRGLLDGIRSAGIDDETLHRWTESIQLERHVHRLHAHRVLYLYGVYDTVDPSPSLERLERALQPTRTVRIRAGHGDMLLYRRRILREVARFLAES